MLNRKNVASLLFVFLCGCATYHAPFKWLPEAGEVPSDPYGSWIETENIIPGSKELQVERGELIAVEKDTVYILDNYFKSLPVKNIKSARLVKYRTNEAIEGVWTGLGSLSTISNGFALIFTLPVWLIGGTISASVRSFEAIMDYPKHNLQEFTPYARFPQGLPPGFIKEFLAPKKYVSPVIAKEKK